LSHVEISIEFNKNVPIILSIKKNLASLPGIIINLDL